MLGEIKCVFNIDLKRFSDSSGIRMSSGSEFQTTGPETRKLLSPKRRVLVRGTVGSHHTADRRWALAPTSRTGLQVRLRYVEPRPWRVLWTWTRTSLSTVQSCNHCTNAPDMIRLEQNRKQSNYRLDWQDKSSLIINWNDTVLWEPLKRVKLNWFYIIRHTPVEITESVGIYKLEASTNSMHVSNTK